MQNHMALQNFTLYKATFQYCLPENALEMHFQANSIAEKMEAEKMV